MSLLRTFVWIDNAQYFSVYSLVSVCVCVWAPPFCIFGVPQIAHPPPSLIVTPPSLFLCLFFFKSVDCHDRFSVWQFDFSKIIPATFVTISVPFPLFYCRKEAKKWAECPLCSSLTRLPLHIHFLSPFRGGMAAERWQPAQEFYREHSQST